MRNAAFRFLSVTELPSEKVRSECLTLFFPKFAAVFGTVTGPPAKKKTEMASTHVWLGISTHVSIKNAPKHQMIIPNISMFKRIPQTKVLSGIAEPFREIAMSILSLGHVKP